MADFEKKLNEQLEKIENVSINLDIIIVVVLRIYIKNKFKIYFKPDESLLKRNLLGTLMVNLIECNVIKESFEINNLMRLSQAKNKSKEINRVLYMEIEDKLISSSYLFGLQICEFREKLIYKETAENHLLHASVMCKADINFNKSKFKQTVSSVYDEILLTLDHIQQGKQNLCKFNLLSNNLIIYPTIFTRRIYNMVCCTHYGKRYLYTIEIDELNNMRKNSVYIYRLFKKGPIICGEVKINEPECMTVNDVDILVLTSSNNIAKLDSSKKEFKIMQLPSVLVDAKGLGVDRYSNIMTTAFENGNKFRCLFILNYDNLSIMKKIEMAGINNDFYHIYIHYDRLFIYNEEKIIGFVFE